jgi:hypothetical protein
MRKKAEAKDAAGKHIPTPKPSKFAIGLAAYMQTITRTRPLCGHEEEEQVSNEEESDLNSLFVPNNILEKFEHRKVIGSLQRFYRSSMVKTWSDKLTTNFLNGERQLCSNTLFSRF